MLSPRGKTNQISRSVPVVLSRPTTTDGIARRATMLNKNKRAGLTKFSCACLHRWREKVTRQPSGRANLCPMLGCATVPFSALPHCRPAEKGISNKRLENNYGKNSPKQSGKRESERESTPLEIVQIKIHPGKTAH